MHVEAHHTISELERHARAEKVARVAVHIRAVILARRGRDAPSIRRYTRSLAPRRAAVGAVVQPGRARRPAGCAAARLAAQAHPRPGGRAALLARRGAGSTVR